MGSDMGQKKTRPSEMLKLCGVFLAGCLVSLLLSSSRTISSSDCLVSLGRYVLRGVRQPQELFTMVHPEDATGTPQSV